MVASTAGYSRRSQLDKLRVKPGTRIAVLKLDDPVLRREVESRTANVAFTRPRQDSDLIFFYVCEKRELVRLSALRTKLERSGAIWVLWRKGRRELRESDVRSAALAAGLVDVKIVAYSEVLSGLKLVIPVAQR